MARTAVLSLACFCAALVAAPAAEAKLTATVTLTPSATSTRIAVKLKSSHKFTKASKPRKVKVKAGKLGYRLKRTKSSRKSTSWRTKAVKGKDAAALAGQVGKRITVSVYTKKGKRKLRPKLKLKTAGGGGGGPGTLFAPPGQALTGNPAFAHISRYFVNSRFTDCPAGWPNCSVEQRYNHCAGGGQGGKWEYHRLTPTSGSDINAVGTYYVTGAVVAADGSWQVEYVHEGYGAQSFYHWEIAQNGTVLGNYWAPGNDPRSTAPTERIGPLRWQQPANCGTL